MAFPAQPVQFQHGDVSGLAQLAQLLGQQRRQEREQDMYMQRRAQDQQLLSQIHPLATQAAQRPHGFMAERSSRNPGQQGAINQAFHLQQAGDRLRRREAMNARRQAPPLDLGPSAPAGGGMMPDPRFETPQPSGFGVRPSTGESQGGFAGPAAQPPMLPAEQSQALQGVQGMGLTPQQEQIATQSILSGMNPNQAVTQARLLTQGGASNGGMSRSQLQQERMRLQRMAADRSEPPSVREVAGEQIKWINQQLEGGGQQQGGVQPQQQPQSPQVQQSMDAAQQYAQKHDAAGVGTFLPPTSRSTQITKSGMMQRRPIDPGTGTGSGRADDAGITAPRQISTEDEYNALPSGAMFIAPDGTVRRKP